MLEVRTGCRLHFGLMELCPEQPLRYAGLGLMLEQPGWWIHLGRKPTRASPTRVEQEVRTRIESVLKGDAVGSPWSVQVRQGLALHAGLGAGTQLAAAVAAAKAIGESGRCDTRLPRHDAGDDAGNDAGNDAGYNAGDELAPPTPLDLERELDSPWQPVATYLNEPLEPARLACLARRGLRSAVGLQGFLSGGLVLDYGLGETTRHTRDVTAVHRPLAADWRVLLIQQPCATPMTGEREASLLGALGASPNPHRSEMLQLAQTALATGDDFQQFTACLEQYMVLAGQLFAPQQGGLYNGPDIAEAVAQARAAGLAAVGQSSWGPSVFGFAADDETAQRAATYLQGRNTRWNVMISRGATTGAVARCCEATREQPSQID